MWKMVQSKKIYLSFFVFAFVLLCWEPSPIGAKEGPKHPKYPEQGVTNPDQHKIEFEYKPGSDKGPEKWGSLRKEWDTCKIGKSQSPIELRDDLVKKVPKKSGDIIINYKSANATLKNEGHAIMVVWAAGAGSITINGTEYFLTQCHWHTPSEHTINGKRYDAELHMVHKSKNNSVAVVGFLYKIGKPNPFLSQVRKAMLSVAGKATDNNLGVIEPRKMKKAQQQADKKKSKTNDKYKNGSSKFYRYMGSFTTPPCTEGVTWTINKKVHTVSTSQVKLLQKAVFDYATMNARPLQPLYGREIKLHGSHFGQ